MAAPAYSKVILDIHKCARGGFKADKYLCWKAGQAPEVRVCMIALGKMTPTLRTDHAPARVAAVMTATCKCQPLITVPVLAIGTRRGSMATAGPASARRSST